jgi:SOS-response transcriptional repressor LexA
MNGDWKHEAKQASIQGMIDWIAEYMLENGYPPCKQEIETGLNKSTSVINAWLKEARALKLIDYSAKTRSYQIPNICYVDNRSQA